MIPRLKGLGSLGQLPSGTFGNRRLACVTPVFMSHHTSKGVESSYNVGKRGVSRHLATNYVLSYCCPFFRFWVVDGPVTSWYVIRLVLMFILLLVSYCPLSYESVLMVI